MGHTLLTNYQKTKEEYYQKSIAQQWRVEVIKKYKREGNLLEIGASIVAFAHASQMNGFHVDVIEFSAECCEYIRNNAKINVYNSETTLDVLLSINKKYDVIALWQSLEHLVQAPEILLRCSNMLNSDGIIVIGTVNPLSLQAKIFSKYWLHLDAPRHVFLYPPDALKKFMNKCSL